MNSDSILTQSDELNRRLCEIEREFGKVSISDIEKSHYLHINKTPKPNANIIHEYNRIRSESPSFNSTVQFPIPAFGDFFNDAVINIKLGSITALNIDYFEDPIANPIRNEERIGYVEYLGEKIIKSARFLLRDHESQEIEQIYDEYDHNRYMFYREFQLDHSKKKGYDKMMCKNNTIDINLGEIDLWIPLMFFFNGEIYNSIPSVSVPYGNRKIEIDLADINSILKSYHPFKPICGNEIPIPEIINCDLYINNIFVNPEIHDIFIKDQPCRLIRTYNTQILKCNGFSSIVFDSAVECVYLKFTQKQVGKNINTDIPNDYIYTTQFDEYFSLGEIDLAMNAKDNFITTAHGNKIKCLSYFYNLDPNLILNEVVVNNMTNIELINYWLEYYELPAINSFDKWRMPPVNGFGIGTGYKQKIIYENEPLIKNLRIGCRGKDLFYGPEKMFNSYIPWTCGNTPGDNLYMITFSLNPNEFQTSGQFNWNEPNIMHLYCDPIEPIEIIVMTQCIKKLRLTDGVMFIENI